MKTCKGCSHPTEFNQRLVCQWCGRTYGDPMITAALLETQRDKTDDELIDAMANGDFAAAEEYRRRYLS